jgi:acetyl esterase/lipase
MALAYDKDFYTHARPAIEASLGLPALPANDVQGRRDRIIATLAAFQKSPLQQATAVSSDVDPSNGASEKDDLHERVYTCKSSDGEDITVYYYSTTPPDPAHPGPAIVHAHGGGMIIREMQMMLADVKENVRRSGLPIFTVDYRVAPEVKAPTPVEDVYAVLVWLHEHAAELGVDPGRIAIMGESAGGGIAASVTILARDRGLNPPIAKQILVYPMLDDRNVVQDAALKPPAFWTYDDNMTGWTALLGDARGTDRVSPYAAAARLKDGKGLPATYIDVGGLDIFRDEDMVYAQRLAKSNVEVDFHLYPGVPHGFDILAPGAVLAKQATENRVRAMRSF